MRNILFGDYLLISLELSLWMFFSLFSVHTTESKPTKPVFANAEDCNSFKHKDMIRMGKTRFVLFNPKDPTLKSLWSQATDRCNNQLRYHVEPPIYLDKVSTNAIIARHLELLAEKDILLHYSFWIGAKAQTPGYADYRWHDKFTSLVGAIKYGNIFYRAPRIIGKTQLSGSTYQNESEEFDVNQVHHKLTDKIKEGQRCLAFSLPFKNKPNLGWQTSWTEVDCSNSYSTLCELPQDPCEENRSLDPHVLTEDKEYYYTEGTWLFANRRYVVNWKPRQKKQAKEWCESMGMKLLSPRPDRDMCLVPYLKSFFSVISTYHFWTDYIFDSKTHEFLNADLKHVVQRKVKHAQFYDTHETGNRTAMEGRSARRKSALSAVSFMWSYERKNETRCKEIDCKWMYYMLAPVTEYLHIGTICQHLVEDNSRVCDFQKSWHEDYHRALEPTAVVEFGYPGSGYWRSTYKQTFGSRICGAPDRQMVGKHNPYWNVTMKDVEYRYDYLETYWVVDEDLFKHVGKHEPLCTVSTNRQVLITNKRHKEYSYIQEYKKVNCDEWHFYLCELVY